MKRVKILGVIAIIAIAMVVVAVVLTRDTAKNTSKKPAQQVAQEIPQGTQFKEVKRLSAGKKAACLTPDPALDKVIQDDEKLPYEKSFGMAIGTVITDMPAGFTEVHLHSYTPTRASGYEVFSDKNQKSFVGNLKSFNFTIDRANDTSTWKLRSFIACSE